LLIPNTAEYIGTAQSDGEKEGNKCDYDVTKQNILGL
jgi:hypothetical protein